MANTWAYAGWRFGVWRELESYSYVEIDQLVNEGVIHPGMDPPDCREAIAERDRVRLLRAGFGHTPKAQYHRTGKPED